jgi:hypothetical protein
MVLGSVVPMIMGTLVNFLRTRCRKGICTPGSVPFMGLLDEEKVGPAEKGGAQLLVDHGEPKGVS